MDVRKSGPARRAGGLMALAVLVGTLPAVAQPGNPCPPLKSSIKASFAENLTGLASARAAITRATQNLNAFGTVVDGVVAAKADCKKMTEDKNSQGSVVAYQCLGDASYLLAKYRSDQGALQRDTDYSDASCAYTRQAALVAKEKTQGPRERQYRANALEGQGNVLQGRSELGGANASQFLFDAIKSYDQAANLQPTHQRYLALARAQNAARDLRGANASYDKLQGLEANATAFPDSLRVAALREQARIQQSDPGAFPAAGMRDIWNKARKLDSTAESHFGYAKTYFDAGDLAAAKTAFGEAAGARNETTGGGINYANEAAYYVAVIEARSASSTAQWAQVLSSVQRTGLTDARYKRLACVAYLRRGGAANFTRDDPAGPCTGDETTEGLLLRGMYMLRRAQYLPDACKDPNPTCSRSEYQSRLTGFLTGAINTFGRGKGLATNEAVFNWQEQPNASEPKMKASLEFGEALANKLSRIDGCQGAAPSGAAAAVELFKRLDLIGCTPSGN